MGDYKSVHTHRLEQLAAREAAKSPLKRAMNPFNIVQPHATNFGSGLELKGGWGLGISMAAFGVAGIASAVNSNLLEPRRQVARGAVDVGSIEAMNYDAVSNGPRKDLGATGELVFGLHNSRKGR